MFPYDPKIAALFQAPVHSIAEVLGTLHAIDALSIDGDGLKWFNRLYIHARQWKPELMQVALPIPRGSRCWMWSSRASISRLFPDI